jgi:hypothetical protein
MRVPLTRFVGDEIPLKRSIALSPTTVQPLIAEGRGFSRDGEKAAMEIV